MTDLELQRWLAAQLPVEIETGIGIDGRPCFWWRKNNNPITPCEWLHVVSLVEANLKEEQGAAYDKRVKPRDSWQQRTRALMEILK